MTTYNGSLYRKRFSTRLEQALKIRNMKQIDLAKKTGIGRSAISQYLSGLNEPRQDYIFKIAEALNVSEAWLMGFDVEMDAMPYMGKVDLVERNHAQKKRGVRIPVLGRVIAGIPIEAIEEIIDYEEITEQMARTGDFYALQIKGDSMEPQMSEGDVVIVRKQEDLDSGQIGIVLVNGDEATVKKVVKKENGIMLVPFNSNYEPWFYDQYDIETKPVKIIGRVVELRKKY